MDKDAGVKLKCDKNYAPFPVMDGEEIFRNIFRFNITKIMEHIEQGIIKLMRSTDDKDTVEIDVMEWCHEHPFRDSINEDHLNNVDITRPVLQAEFNPGYYKLIDGNHRMELAYRMGIATIESYQLSVEQLIPYFADVRGYESFVGYWNSKLN